MTRYLILFILSGIAFRGLAQQSHVCDTVRIYFASNQSQIDAAQQLVLQNFAQTALLWEDCSVQLEATNDDINSLDANKALADQRVSNVIDVLLDNGLAIQSLSVNMPIYLEEAQATLPQNRFVTLYYQLKNPKKTATAATTAALKNLFEDEIGAATQQFIIQSNQNQFITSDKGTFVQIPKNCFALENGTIYQGRVSVQLLEAYSLADMLKMNLTTLSNGQLLETAGMFHIEAQDSIGNQLYIAAQKEILVSLRNEKASAAGMKVFEGERYDDGAINWQATQAVLPPDNYTTLESSFAPNLFFVGQDQPDANIEDLKKLPVLEHKIPLYYKPQKSATRAPRRPKIKQPQRPDKGIVQAALTPKKNESDFQFQIRSNGIYQKQMKKYRLQSKRVRLAFNDYRRDSLKHARITTKNEANFAKFEQRDATLKAAFAEMQNKNAAFDYEAYYATFNQMKLGFNNMDIQCQNMVHNFDELHYSLKQMQAAGYDCQGLLAEIQATTLPSNLSQIGQKLDGIFSVWTYSNSGFSINSYYHQKHLQKIETYKHQLAKITEKWPTDKFAKKRHYRQVQHLQHFFKMKDEHKNVVQHIRRYEQHKKSVAQYMAAKETVLYFTAQVQALRESYDLVSASEKLKNYTNILRVGKLGWINCDRFINTPEIERIDCHILVENELQGQYYMIFKEIDAIIPGTRVGNQILFNSIPSTMEVQVVSFAIDETNNSYTAELEGKAIKLKGKTLEYQTEEDISAYLSVLAF